MNNFNTFLFTYIHFNMLLCFNISIYINKIIYIFIIHFLYF